MGRAAHARERRARGRFGGGRPRRGPRPRERRGLVARVEPEVPHQVTPGLGDVPREALHEVRARQREKLLLAVPLIRVPEHHRVLRQRHELAIAERPAAQIAPEIDQHPAAVRVGDCGAGVGKKPGALRGRELLGVGVAVGLTSCAAELTTNTKKTAAARKYFFIQILLRNTGTSYNFFT